MDLAIVKLARSFAHANFNPSPCPHGATRIQPSEELANSIRYREPATRINVSEDAETLLEKQRSEETLIGFQVRAPLPAYPDRFRISDTNATREIESVVRSRNANNNHSGVLALKILCLHYIAIGIRYA